MAKFQGVHEAALREFSERVVENLGELVDFMVVYGSVARGEAGEESDIDVLIVSGEKGKVEEKVLDISYDIDLKYGTAMSLVHLTRQEVEHRIRVGSPFMEDILIQGVVLYERNQAFQGIRERVLKASG